MSIIDKVVAVVTPSRGEPEADAIGLLKQDHDEVNTLFTEYEALADGGGGDPGDKRVLSTQICGLLVVHAMIEEEIFYPAARSAGVDAALLNEAAVEHGSAKELIAQIGESGPSDALYDARVKVLGEYIRHHVKEEEGELFSACRRSKMDLAAVGTALRKRKDVLMRKLRGQ
ncbi:MAG: hemerythrin domain-containing protein [Dokdonella sp.]